MLIKGVLLVTLLATGLFAWGAMTKPAQEFTDQFQQTYSLASNGEVSIVNNTGSVRVVGWDRDEVKVEAVKRAYSESRLADAEIQVQSDAGAITIQTTYPSKELVWRSDRQGRIGNPALVDLTVYVPRGAKLVKAQLTNGDIEVSGVRGGSKVSTVNGKLKAEKLGGDVHLSVVEGRLEATFTKVESTQNITLSSTNAEVVLSLPENTDAEILANAAHGSLKNEFGLPVKKLEEVRVSADTTRGGGVEINGRIGNGGAKISLFTDRGSLQINRSTRSEVGKN
jgi:Putative adhesin